MTSQANRCWGINSIWLRLPTGNVHFNGLSTTQVSLLHRLYPNFISDVIKKTSEYDVHCCVYRLKQLPAVSAEALTIEGQYVPRKALKQEGIELTGSNFEACIGLRSKSLHLSSSLGFSEERDFVNVGVIENFLRVLTAHQSLEHGGLVLHSAGLVFADHAYIFSGRSNAGKTTLTRKAYKNGARVLSDDINLLLPSPKGYKAHAIPFTGEFGRTLNHSGAQDAYPVAGIILLEQGDELITSAVSTSDAVATLLAGCPFVNTAAEESSRLFDAVINLVAELPVIRLFSRREDNVGDIMAVVTRQLKQAEN